VSLDEARQKLLAEQLHERFAAPGQEGMKRAIVREATVGQEKVTVRMPMDQIAACGDGDDDAGPSVRADLSPDVLGCGLGGALGEVEQKLPPFAEDPPQEAWHGEDARATAAASGSRGSTAATP
jgi:hypothetical protein